MTNQEFIREVVTVYQNIRNINGKFEETKRWHKVSKLAEELEYFHIESDKRDYFKIHYENSIIGYQGCVSRKDPNIIYPLMLLYTNVAYRMQQLKPYVASNMYQALYKEKARLGKAIRTMCTTEIQSTMPLQVSLVEKFVQRAIKQLHHCVGKIGEYSEEVYPEDSERLRQIRKIYESFKIGEEYVSFYDEILRRNTRISLNSPSFNYAVMLLFSRVYGKSLLWLWKNYPSGHWCPISPWKVIGEFESIHWKMFR